MGTTQFGYPQTLTYKYNSDATAKLFNGVNYELIPIGIYSGFTLSKISNTYVEISTGICYIQDSTTKMGTRVETGSVQQIEVSSSMPYLVFRFNWVDASNNYMDMLATDYASILADDIIVGRCVYDNAGTTLSTVFDYSRRTTQYLNKNKIESAYLKVLPTEPYSNQFTVSAGVLNSSKGNLLISGGTFPSGGLSDTINGRIDLIYVDEDGVVQILQGTDSSSPVAPRYGNRKVIAEIRRGASRTSIRGSEVFQVISSFDASAITSDQLITDSGDFYSASNVEDALQEIAGSDFAFSGEKTFNGGLLAKASQIITGATGSDIQTLKKSDGTTIQRNDLNGKLYNTVGADIPFLDQGSVYTTDKYEEALNQIGNGTMTIKGVKTFNSSPIVPTPTTSTQAATKGYVDTADTTLQTNINTANSNLSTHAALKATSTLGHIITGGDIDVSASTGQVTLKSIVTAATYPKVTFDAKGRVTAGYALSASDIPSLDGSKITSGIVPNANVAKTVDGVQVSALMKNNSLGTRVKTVQTLTAVGSTYVIPAGEYYISCLCIGNAVGVLEIKESTEGWEILASFSASIAHTGITKSDGVNLRVRYFSGSGGASHVVVIGHFSI